MFCILNTCSPVSDKPSGLPLAAARTLTAVLPVPRKKLYITSLGAYKVNKNSSSIVARIPSLGASVNKVQALVYWETAWPLMITPKRRNPLKTLALSDWSLAISSQSNWPMAGVNWKLYFIKLST